MTSETEPLLQVEDLIKTYPAEDGGFLASLLGGAGQRVPALNGISFNLKPGEVLGLSGESGSGKSALAHIIAGYEKPDRGRVTFMGKNLTAMGENDLKAIRRNLRYLPEDAFNNLPSTPQNRVDRILFDVVDRYKQVGVTRTTALDLLKRVGLGEQYLNRFPNQMSGGEKQRLAIARAMMLKPRLIVADEPVSNLDTTSRTEVLSLMKRLGQEYGTAFIFISHNLSIVRYFVGDSRLAVMFAGRFIEEVPAPDVFAKATHPYTKTLLEISPLPSPLPAAALDPFQAQLEREQVDTAENHVAAQAQLAAQAVGCPFYNWCPERFERCTQETPQLLPVSYVRDEDNQLIKLAEAEIDPAHRAACFRYIDQ